MKGGKRRPLLIGLALAVLVAVFLVASLNTAGKRTVREVRMEKVKRDRLESWVRAPGQIRPERLVQISSNVMGRIEELAVQEGDRVRQGDLLLALDDERYRSIVAGMQAQVNAGKAELTLAEAQLDRSRRSLARQEKLAAEHLLSDEGLEQARTTTKVDQARYDATVEDLRRIRASLAEAEKNIKESVFRAPIDGIVTALNVEKGENVITGTMNNPGTVILTLANLDTMEVEAEVDETDVTRVSPGLSAKIKVDAWEDSSLVGVVTSVGMSGRRGSATTQQSATNFKVKVRIVDPPDALRPGMSADIEVLSGVRDSALVVPIQALVAQPERVVKRWEEERAKGASSSAKPGGTAKAETSLADTARANEKMVEGIFLVREGRARFIPVRLGLRGDTQVEVAGDVRVGDSVVAGPYRVLRALKEGDSVKQEKAKKAVKSKGQQAGES